MANESDGAGLCSGGFHGVWLRHDGDFVSHEDAVSVVAVSPRRLCVGIEPGGDDIYLGTGADQLVLKVCHPSVRRAAGVSKRTAVFCGFDIRGLHIRMPLEYCGGGVQDSGVQYGLASGDIVIGTIGLKIAGFRKILSEL